MRGTSEPRRCFAPFTGSWVVDARTDSLAFALAAVFNLDLDRFDLPADVRIHDNGTG